MADVRRLSDYKCPLPWDEKYGADVYRLGWVKEAIQEGTNYLKLQRAYPMLDKAIDIISGYEEDPVPKSLSDVKSNRLKMHVREIVATLSNLRPIFSFKSENELFQTSVDHLNKTTVAWWKTTRAARKFRAALQWATVSTGYLSPVWERNFWPNGKGDIDLKPYGPRDVLPVQIGRDHNIQDAYAIVICNEVPINKAREMYPQFADLMKPDRETPSWYSGMLGRIRNKARSTYPRHLLDIIGGQKEDSTPSGPTIDIYNIYIKDQSVNMANRMISMGKPGTTWHYQVPFMGQDIKTNSIAGADTRKATEDDCRMFPLRRLIVATQHAILYDDTSFWWHGMVPLIQLRLDDWVDQFLGYSLIHDAYPLSRAMNDNLRGYQDYLSKCLRPNLKYAPEGVAKSHINRYDPRVSGQKIPVNMAMGEDIVYEDPPKLTASPIEMHNLLKAEMADIMATPSMKDLARANQVPSQETFEKLQEIAGPIVQDMSGGMEEALIPLGEMVKGLIHQFYRAPRKISMMGKDGVTEEDFKFEPHMLIPSEFREGQLPEVYPKFDIPDNLERARRVMGGSLFNVVPGSLHQITQTQRKLFLMQFWRDQRFPIDPQTVAEAFDFTNFGELPGSPHTIFDRWQVWKKIENDMNIQLMLQQEKAKMELMAQMQPQADPNADPNAAGGEAGGQPGKAAPGEGRKPSADKPPHIEQKDGGTRQTVSES